MISRTRVAIYLAFVVVIVHIFVISAAWAYDGKEGLAVDMIMLPTLAAYAAGAVKWIIANPRMDNAAPPDTVGWHYVLMLALVGLVFLGALLAGVVGLFTGWDFVAASVDVANRYFALVESGFGMLFGYFYDDLFGKRAEGRVDPSPSPAPHSPPA